MYKANWDAAFDVKKNKMRIGIVIRDSRGEVIATLFNCEDHVTSQKIAEFNALRRALVLCAEIDIHAVVFEGDAKSIIEEINSVEESWAPYGLLLVE